MGPQERWSDYTSHFLLKPFGTPKVGGVMRWLVYRVKTSSMKDRGLLINI